MVSRLLVLTLVAPLAINAVVWSAVLTPLQANLQRLRNLEAATEMRPQLEKMIRESDGILQTWSTTSFGRDDVAAVSPAIRRSAARQHLTLTDIKESSGGMFTGPNVRSLEVQASGRFNKLARWMSDLEKGAGFVVDSCSMKGDGTGNCTMTLRVTAFLGEQA
jgi:type II secretory pathway component PulM